MAGEDRFLEFGGRLAADRATLLRALERAGWERYTSGEEPEPPDVEALDEALTRSLRTLREVSQDDNFWDALDELARRAEASTEGVDLEELIERLNGLILAFEPFTRPNSRGSALALTAIEEARELEREDPAMSIAVAREELAAAVERGETAIRTGDRADVLQSAGEALIWQELLIDASIAGAAGLLTGGLAGAAIGIGGCLVSAGLKRIGRWVRKWRAARRPRAQADAEWPGAIVAQLLEHADALADCERDGDELALVEVQARLAEVKRLLVQLRQNRHAAVAWITRAKGNSTQYKAALRDVAKAALALDDALVSRSGSVWTLTATLRSSLLLLADVEFSGGGR